MKKDVKTGFTTLWAANNEGLNEMNLTVEKQGKHLMIFGVSFTEGVGASSDSSFPRTLEKLLHQKFDSTIQVINCGIAGSDIFTEYELLKLRMMKYKPESYSNDSAPNARLDAVPHRLVLNSSVAMLPSVLPEKNRLLIPQNELECFRA